jgi:hypothetical protein
MGILCSEEINQQDEVRLIQETCGSADSAIFAGYSKLAINLGSAVFRYL